MGSTYKRAVVLGADIEGLAAAATLAQAGLDVHLVDGLADRSGVARAIEVHAGHSVPGLLHETSLVRRQLLAHLNLDQHGLSWRADEAPVHVCRASGEVLSIGRSSIGDGPDAAAYLRWRGFIDKLAPLISGVIDSLPPEANDPGMLELFRLARTGFKLRKLGEADMMELLRIVTMPAWDWMDECFEDPALRAGLCALVLPGTVIGPRAAGTTALMLMREAARGPEPVGGLAAVAEALRACCEALGVKLHLGAKPASIQADHAGASVVTGVELESGETLAADLVLSTLDPATTLLELVDPAHVPHNVEAQVETWRTRGSSAVHLLALSAPAGLPADAQRLVTASAPVQLERCADALKYGELPAEPWLDVRDWSRSDPSCAPQGCATLSVHIHGVPHDLKGGWTDAARQELREKTLAALEAVAPGTRATLVADQLLTPPELEQQFGLRGGHLYGGEMVLDQLWLQRPCLALSRYGSPIAGLLLGGGGNHPGGAFVGGAGVLAARRALGR